MVIYLQTCCTIFSLFVRKCCGKIPGQRYLASVQKKANQSNNFLDDNIIQDYDFLAAEIN